MTKRWGFSSIILAVLVLVAIRCSKNAAPTQPQQSTVPQLTAVPSSVAVGVGVSQNVTISGGTPPYDIASPPSSIATAQLLNRDSLSASVQIVGVTVASVGTAVTIKDNSASTPKTVTVPITVH